MRYNDTPANPNFKYTYIIKLHLHYVNNTYLSSAYSFLLGTMQIQFHLNIWLLA